MNTPAPAGPAREESLGAFLRFPSLAVVGVSADRKKFGNIIFRTLKERGVRVYPIHRSLGEVEGVPCYSTLGALPEKVEGVVTVIPPAETEKFVETCPGAGVKAIWMQQGSESPKAEARARELGMQVVAGECLLMYLEPVGSIHGLHRWFKKLFGTYTPPSAGA
jgi:uncharacterized protein